jgi:hypothetical protein
MVNQNDFVRAEQAVRDQNRPDRIVRRYTAGVPDDVGFAFF